MSQIDTFNRQILNISPKTLQPEEATSKNLPAQLTPAKPLAAIAQSQLQNIRMEALSEAAESMSLVMGSRLQSLRKADTKNSNARLKDLLTSWVAKVEGPALVELISAFSNLGSSSTEDPILTMQKSGVPNGAMILLLSSLLGDPRLTPQRRKRLENALMTLLDDESFEIDLFSFLELGALKPNDLAPLKQLYQRSRRQDESPTGLVEWFEEVRQWPERRVRLKILLRALAADFGAEADHEQQVHIVATIMELKRLLLFFSIEDHCVFLAYASGLSNEQTLKEVLSLLEQSWVYPESIEERMQQLSIAGERRISYVRRALELFRLMPEPCFQDEQQAEQIIEAFEQLQTRLAELEDTQSE